MASYMADAALNRAADELTSQTLTLYVYTGAPGNNGTANRLVPTVAVAAGGWTAAASGVSETSADAAFGVLSTTQSRTITAYGVFDGATFLGWADLTADVVVAANESFTLNAGTVEFSFARP